MLQLLILLLACGEKETDSGDPQEENTEENEPGGEPGGEPAGEPGGGPSGGESPDDFPSTCSAEPMNNDVTTDLDGASFSLTEAVWDIEEFGFMTVVLGVAGDTSLCDRVLNESFEGEPNAVALMTGQGGLRSSDSYNISVDVIDGDPGMEYASVTFEDGAGGIEGFSQGTIDVSSYTYGADMTFSLSVGDSDNTLSASDITACYCPGALEIAANF